MGRPLRIISIDGTRGSGKTSQIAMLSKYFKLAGMRVSTLKTIDGDPIQSGIAAISCAESILSQGPENLIILDGSIARPMVMDIINGVTPTNLLDKFKTLTQKYEKLDHQYEIANFLMVMDDLEECNRRISKFANLTGQEVNSISNIHLEHDIVSGMRFFNNHIASKNISFQVVDVSPHQSMNEIHNIILSKLEKKYDFDKPKRDRDEW